ncbi:MAG: NAD(+) kinase [Acidiferrobacterales bacterium]
MSLVIKTVGLFGKYGDDIAGNDIVMLAKFLRGNNYEVVIETSSAEVIHGDVGPRESIENIGKHIDLAIVIGGDGTLLHVARNLMEHAVPLIGVNLGRLGFLTDIPAENMIEAINKILGGEFETEERFLLSAKVMRNGTIASTNVAFNDVIIGKGELSRMIELEVFDDGEFVHSMRGDGIIVATPTGSTAYAMSAGGPILHPELQAFTLVPICPHALSNRPIVVGADSFIEIVVKGVNQQRTYATFDGQENYALEQEDRVCIRKADTPVVLLHPAHRSHYDVLRAKLHWGGIY